VSWYISTPPVTGSGHRTRRRVLAERIVGAGFSSRVARQITVSRAEVNRRGTRLGRDSTRKLDQLRDRYRGERCVIIGNGPSLNHTDLGLLAGEHTFGLNRIYLMAERLGFHPGFHVVVNSLVVEQCAADLVRVPGQLFSTWSNRADLTSHPNAVFLQNVVGPIFSLDARRGIWEGATVTYVAMQLAYHMGFSEVVLVGVDHSFASKGPAHKVVTSEGADPNHFDPNYFGRGFRWQLPDLETSEIAYRLARTAFEADGRRIVDCTVGGVLTVFPKGELAAQLGKEAVGDTAATP
jgi:6-hydroxymethylpterin diphosphokinase MptE-like